MNVIVGDCVEVMRGMEPDSIDAIVTDPPAGIAFMNAHWDHDKGGRAQWIAWMAGVAAEALRVAKPGAHALVWALPRTSHWTATAWEDGGWEVRDRVLHLTGQGFPKSLDVSKAIDRAAGAERERLPRPRRRERLPRRVGIPATDLARQWDGWGTALKPAAEDWWLMRKPLVRGSGVAANVTQYGTGALNIDACRIGTDVLPEQRAGQSRLGTFERHDMVTPEHVGRWPPNVILGCACEGEPHDPECAVAMLDAQSGESASTARRGPPGGSTFGGGEMRAQEGEWYGDTGGASRFLYVAKSSRAEREAWGRMTLPPERRTDGRTKDIENPRLRTSERVNHHATVKPLALMEWLIKLVLPLRVLDWRCPSCYNPLTDESTTTLQTMSETVHSGESTDILLDSLSRDESSGGAPGMPDMQETDHPGATDSLFGRVPSSLIPPSPDAIPSPLRAVRGDVPADEGWQATLLLAEMRTEGDRTSAAETRRTEGGERLRASAGTGAPNGFSGGLRARTSPDHGDGARSPSDAARSRTSSQRNKRRQSPSQSATNGEARARQPHEHKAGTPSDVPSMSARVPDGGKCAKCDARLIPIERAGILLDPFCGSGSTLVAARRLNVEAIGIEQDESYAEIARQRIAAQWEVRML